MLFIFKSRSHSRAISQNFIYEKFWVGLKIFETKTYNGSWSLRRKTQSWKSSFYAQGSGVDPGVLSTSPLPRLDEMQELSEIQNNAMDNLKQRAGAPCIWQWERNYCPSSGHQELALPRSKVQVTRQVLQICQEKHNKSSCLEAKNQENCSVALEIIGNSKINYNTWSNSCVPGDMEDSPLTDVFQPKMWLLPSKMYFRQTQVLGSVKVTGPRYRGSQTGWSILAFINLQNPSTGTLPEMPEIQRPRPKRWVSHVHLCPSFSPCSQLGESNGSCSHQAGASLVKNSDNALPVLSSGDHAVSQCVRPKKMCGPVHSWQKHRFTKAYN